MWGAVTVSVNMWWTHSGPSSYKYVIGHNEGRDSLIVCGNIALMAIQNFNGPTYTLNIERECFSKQNSYWSCTFDSDINVYNSAEFSIFLLTTEFIGWSIENSGRLPLAWIEIFFCSIKLFLVKISSLAWSARFTEDCLCLPNKADIVEHSRPRQGGEVRVRQCCDSLSLSSQWNFILYNLQYCDWSVKA